MNEYTLEELREKQDKLFNRGKAGAVTVNEDYSKKINAQPGTLGVDVFKKYLEKPSYTKEFIKYPFELNDIKSGISAIYEGIIQRKNKNIKVLYDDGNLKEILLNLTLYFLGENGEYDINKGIYIYGEVGRSKTVLMDTFSAFTNKAETFIASNRQEVTKRAFRIISTKDIVFEVATAGNVQPIEKYKSGIYCFDDLGHESSVKVFGNDINVVEDLMTCRYRSFQNFGLITHATSNIPPKELANIYGTRLESRVNEMFNFIYLKGSDKRKI